MDAVLAAAAVDPQLTQRLGVSTPLDVMTDVTFLWELLRRVTMHAVGAWKAVDRRGKPFAAVFKPPLRLAAMPQPCTLDSMHSLLPYCTAHCFHTTHYFQANR